MRLKILLVDDDKNIRKTLTVSLEMLDCEVVQAASVSEALKSIEAENFHAVLTDFRMEKATGLDLIQKAKATKPDLIFVVMTAFASIENAIAVTREGAFEYLPKPFTNAQLGHLIERIRKFAALQQENDELRNVRHRKDYFAGLTSTAMARLQEFVKKVAPTDATVLLTGESGTGKSELARLIHQQSKRARRPFITVHGTNLVESLVESELFGHEEGAFTGATKRKIGKLELANGGTLFLDEIGDIAPSVQAKLLSFLQERIVERVGGNETRIVDTRVIAATNRNLVAAVANGTFREDLFYRLNMFECTLVALRHRSEDVPVLIVKILKELADVKGWPQSPVISKPVMDKLKQYSWPGNVREFKNTLERICILADGQQVELSHLPDNFREAAAPEAALPPDTFKTLEAVERDHIKMVLAHESNQERAAGILGITKVTLWRKRKEYGIA